MESKKVFVFVAHFDVQQQQQQHLALIIFISLTNLLKMVVGLPG